MLLTQTTSSVPDADQSVFTLATHASLLSLADAMLICRFHGVCDRLDELDCDHK